MKKAYPRFPIRSKAVLCAFSGLLLVVGMQAAAEEEAIAWRSSYDEGMAEAAAADKPVLIDFTADWCIWCKKMEEEVYSDADVVSVLQDFVCIQVDTDRDPRVAIAYGARTLPRLVILNTFGEITVDRNGYLPVEGFLDAVADGRARAHEKLDANAVPEIKPIETPSQTVERALAESEADRDQVVLKLLSDPNPEVREKAVERLKSNESDAVPLLVAGLSHPNLGTRITSWEALRAWGIDPAPYDPWASRADRAKSAAKWQAWLAKQPARH